jgi:nitroreductase
MFIDLLRARRSIRQYQDRPVEQEKVDLLVEAVLRSPSSRGVNPWEFVVVNDPVTINRLSTKNDGFVKNPISALRFILRHCGVPYVRLIPQDSQALISGFLRIRRKCDFLRVFGNATAAGAPATVQQQHFPKVKNRARPEGAFRRAYGWLFYRRR